MINFAYDTIIDGNGFNRPLRYHSADIDPRSANWPVGAKGWSKVYNPILQLHYWFDNSNIITIEEAIQSDDDFIYSIKTGGIGFGLLNVERFELFSRELVICINSGQCKLVIDDSREGIHWSENDINNFVNGLKAVLINPENVIVLTMTHTYLYKKFPFRMIHWCFCESMIKSQTKLENIKPKKDDAKKFLCLARHNKNERTYFIRQMWDRGILDQFNLSLYKVEGDDDFAKSTPYLYDHLSGSNPEVIENWKFAANLHYWHQEDNYINVVLGSAFLDTQRHDFYFWFR